MNQEAESPLVSVIVVNYNGAAVLPRCLASLAAQICRDFEVILVDNASSDASLTTIEADPPAVPALRILHLERNLGFAAANNLAARQAHGRWLALLNNDAFPAPTWLEELLAAARRRPDCASFASRLLKADQPALLDGAGDILHTSGLGWRRGANQPAESFGLEEVEVFSACAAAALYDRELFLQTGGFDEDFVSYHEDLELGFRLRLLGKGCLYAPRAVVEHVGSASYGADSELNVTYMHRNFVWTYWMDMPGALFWKYLPAHLLANLVFLISYSLRGRLRAIWRAKIQALLGLPRALRKRRLRQAQRTARPDEIDRMLEHDWLAPYTLGRRQNNISSLFGRRGNQE